MTFTQPFPTWIFNFLAVFGFFPISTRKLLRFFQYFTIAVVVTLMYVVGYDFASFI